MCKFLGKLDAFNFAYQNFCAVRHPDVGKRGDFSGRLTDDPCVERAVDKYGLSYFLGFLRVQKIAASIGELGFDGIMLPGQHNTGRL